MFSQPWGEKDDAVFILDERGVVVDVYRNGIDKGVISMIKYSPCIILTGCG